MDDDRIDAAPGMEATSESQTGHRRGLLESIKSGIQGMLTAGLVVISIPVGIAWAGGGTAGAVVAGMERDWGSLGLSLVIPGYGAYYTIKTLLFDSSSSVMNERVLHFILLADAGPTYDNDCIAHGGMPETNLMDLQDEEATMISINEKEYPVLRKASSTFVGYVWPIEDPPHFALGICRFSSK